MLDTHGEILYNLSMINHNPIKDYGPGGALWRLPSAERTKAINDFIKGHDQSHEEAKVTNKKKAVPAGNGKSKFVELAKAKQSAHRKLRAEFLAKFGKAIESAWKAMTKPTSMGVWAAKFPKEKCRLVDYCTLKLGLRSSKDEGLLSWIRDDQVSLSAACPAPKKLTKAEKAKVTKIVAGLNGKAKKVNGDAQVQA